MGVQMAMGSLAPHAANAMPPDCPMHAHADATPADDSASQTSSRADTCSSCDLCIPMAELVNATLEVVSVAARAGPLPVGDDFISASRAPTLKPPIS